MVTCVPFELFPRHIVLPSSGVFFTFYLSRLLFTRRHPAHPMSVPILHPGSLQYHLLDSETKVQRVRCPVRLWIFVLHILHYWGGAYLS